MAATFDARLVDLIGDYMSKLNDNHEIDLLNAAIAEVADSVPPELLLKYAVTPQVLSNSTPTWTGVEGNKILLVTRLEVHQSLSSIQFRQRVKLLRFITLLILLQIKKSRLIHS